MTDEQNLLSEIEEIISSYGQWSKENSAYIDISSNPSEVCSNCSFYREGSCLIVEGEIQPIAHCKLWIMNQQDVLEAEDTTNTEVDIPQHLSQEDDSLNHPKNNGMYPLERVMLSSSVAKVPLAKKGRWKHDRYGVVEFTDQDFNQIIDNLSVDALGHPPYLTFGHLDQEPQSTDSHKKRGDLTGLKVEGDVLYGFFNPRPPAEEAIANGEYEFCSGEFIRNFTDKESGLNKGTVFMRAALTNSPFLPFSEEEKVQLLSSDASTSSTLDVQPFVINLIKDTSSNINPKEECSMTLQPEAQKEPVEIPPVQASTTPEVSNTQEVAATPEESTPAVNANPSALTPPTLDLSSIISQVTDKVEATYKAQLESAVSTINELKSSLTKVTEDLNSQRQVTEAYSLSVNRQEEANLNQSLLSSGVPPTIVQSFSDIRDAMRSKQNSIKLSVGGADKDVTLVQALSQMLIDAVKVEPVAYGQVGAAQSSTGTGVVSEIEAIIAANKARIKK